MSELLRASRTQSCEHEWESNPKTSEMGQRQTSNFGRLKQGELVVKKV